MINDQYVPVIIAGSMCVYVFARNKASVAVQPKRLELAERGEALLASQHLSGKAKDHVRFCLDHAFGSGPVLFLQILFIPIFAALVLFRMRLIRRAAASINIEDKESRLEFIEVCGLFDEISWVNNPILMTITGVEFRVFVSISIILRIVLLSGFPTIDKGALKAAFEELAEKFSNRGSWRHA